MKHYYKFLNYKDGKIVSEHGNQAWEIGREYSVSGAVRRCSNGFHASETPLQALGYVKGNVIARVVCSGDSDNNDDKVCFRTMKIVEAYHWKPKNSIRLAIYAAEQVIKIYEDKYPNDSRPRDAIKAAKAYLKNPTADAADAAAAAAAAAYVAAVVADAVGVGAADADAAAARAAAYAAAAAAAAARAVAAGAAGAAAAAAARAAVAAAADAAGAARAEMTTKINRWVKARIKKLEKIV